MLKNVTECKDTTEGETEGESTQEDVKGCIGDVADCSKIAP